MGQESGDPFKTHYSLLTNRDTMLFVSFIDCKLVIEFITHFAQKIIFGFVSELGIYD